MKKIITIAALVLMGSALCIACKGTDNEKTYTIYTTAANGTIKLSSKKAKAQATITVTADPSSDYELVKGSIQVRTQSNRVTVRRISEAGAQGKYSFRMPAANVVVGVTFKKIVDGGGGPLPLTKNQVFSGGELNNAVLTGYNDRHIPWYCDDEGREEGTQAIRVGPDEFSENGAGFSITRTDGNGIILSEVAALSFWARSPDSARIQSVTLGTDTTAGDTYKITYTGEDDDGIIVDPDWTQYFIPIPGNRSVALDGVFTLRLDRREAGRTLYIDDIEYIAAGVSLQDIVLREPDKISTAETTPLSRIIRGMKAVYIVDGTPVSIFTGNINFESYDNTFMCTVSGSGVSLDGDNVTAVTPGVPYTLSVTLSGVTKQVIGQVSAQRFITIEDCAPAGIGLIEGNSGQAGPGGYRATSWDAAFEQANGKHYLKVYNRRWDGNRDWDREGTAGRNLPTPLNFSTPIAYNKIILTVRAVSPGLGFHFRIWNGATEPPNPNDPGYDPARFSTVALPVTNFWQEVEIPLPSSFKNSERGNEGGVLGNRNDIRRWEVATDNNNFNDNYLYVGSIRVSE